MEAEDEPEDKYMFVGRQEELKSLSSLWGKKVASLVALRGRRRIGKSTLAEEFARRSRAKFVAIDGLPPRPGLTNADQLRNFAEKLALRTGTPEAVADSWFKAFRFLSMSLPSTGRVVVLLDEISWMGRSDPDFPGALKSAWDAFLGRRRDLILIVCGSVSAWIADNILDNTGFAGRFSRDLVLGELPPRDCAAFWGRAAERLAPSEIVDVLSVTGGVPRYLEEIDPARSADENIRALCFTPDGTLFRDFELIFNDVFGERAGTKRRILRALSERPMGESELAAALGVGRGGSLAEHLRVLQMSGFANRDDALNFRTGRASRLERWRLSDNYVRFYLRCVEPREEQIRNRRFPFHSLESLPGWDSLLGLQFENFVLNNVPSLVRPLHLEGVSILSAAPFRQSGKKAAGGGGGVQIDLLLQTARSLHVVEIKRKRAIGPEIEREVREKIARLRAPEGLSVRTALVYEGTLDPAIRADGFFDAVVSSGDLLGIPGLDHAEG